MYAHLINSNIIKIFIKNEIDYIIQIFKKLRLNILYEIDYENVFFIESATLSNKNLSKSFINIIN